MTGEKQKAATDTIHCSFCGNAQEEVRRLIAGPGGVYICDTCITLCHEIMAEETTAEGKPPSQPVALNTREAARTLFNALVAQYQQGTMPVGPRHAKLFGLVRLEQIMLAWSKDSLTQDLVGGTLQEAHDAAVSLVRDYAALLQAFAEGGTEYETSMELPPTPRPN